MLQYLLLFPETITLKYYTEIFMNFGTKRL